jgi:hypothetical protein
MAISIASFLGLLSRERRGGQGEETVERGRGRVVEEKGGDEIVF